MCGVKNWWQKKKRTYCLVGVLVFLDKGILYNVRSVNIGYTKCVLEFKRKGYKHKWFCL